MLARLTSALTVLAVAAAALAQVTVNTPLSVVVCQPVQFTWSGGTGPYFVSLLPGNQPTAAAIVDFGSQSGTSLSWTANLGVGTSFFIQARDSTGTIGQSGTITIQTGTDISCVGQTSSTASTAAATTSVGSVSTGTGVVSTTKAASAGSTSTKAPAASASTTSGAIKFASSGALCLAGLLAVAALL